MAPARSAHPAASIRDVAARAGVSHMTVSRVLNDSANVRQSTHDRVMAAIDELNFRPSRTARALANGRTQMLGVLDATGGLLYGPASTINAVELAGRGVGYSITIAGAASEDPDAIAAALAHLLAQDVAGLIVIGPGRGTRDAIAAMTPDIPIVTMHGADGGSPFADQTDAARRAARHLIELGHTALAHVAGPADWSEATARRDGFCAEAAAAGQDPVVVEVDEWSPDAGYRAGRQLLSGAAVTGVFCADDQIALGLLHAAREAGLEVPRDLSVVGFDDTPESAHYHPPLTTLRQDFAESGRRAVAWILAELGQGPRPAARPVVPELIVRESTAAPHRR